MLKRSTKAINGINKIKSQERPESNNQLSPMPTVRSVMSYKSGRSTKTTKSVKSMNSSISSNKKRAFYDYKCILTANLDLNEVIKKGGNLFFDCPPIQFNENQGRDQFEKEYDNNDYFATVNEKRI